MRKIKAFTLIEILLASFIFMVIVTVGVSALSMMRKSTEASDDLSQAAGCARGLEDFTRSKIQLAQFEDRFYGISISNSGYSVNKIPDNIPTLYSGLAILNSEKEATLIYKSKVDGTYLFATFTSVDSSKPLEIQKKLNSADLKSKIQSDSCRAFFDDPSGPGIPTNFNLDFKKPFNVTKSKTRDGFYHRITLIDFNFSQPLMQTQAQAIDQQSYARIFIDAVVARGGV